MTSASTKLLEADGIWIPREELELSTRLTAAISRGRIQPKSDIVQQTDAGLAFLMLSGNELAFAELVHRHQRWLYRFIYRWMRDAEESQDILQESLISIWKNISKYDRERSFPIWLKRIALNKCRDRSRRRSVRRFLMPWSTGSAEMEYPDPTITAEIGMINEERLGELRHAIDNLPSSYREVIILVALEGLSQTEAGEILRITSKAVEGRLHRAKMHLSNQLNLDNKTSVPT